MSVSERIRLVRKESKLNQADFGAKLGVSQGGVSAWESGRTSPDGSTVLNLCRVFGVSEHWLRTGEGEMYVKKSKDEEILEFFNDVLQDDPEGYRRRMVEAMSKLTEADWAAMAHLVESLTKGKE